MDAPTAPKPSGVQELKTWHKEAIFSATRWERYYQHKMMERYEVINLEIKVISCEVIMAKRQEFLRRCLYRRGQDETYTGDMVQTWKCDRLSQKNMIGLSPIPYRIKTRQNTTKHAISHKHCTSKCTEKHVYDSIPSHTVICTVLTVHRL